jgi:hypothetical protein
MLWCSVRIKLVVVGVLMILACGGSSDDEIEKCQEECRQINQDFFDNRICTGCFPTSRQATQQDHGLATLRSDARVLTVDADLNADGMVDRVTASRDPAEVSIRLFQVDGTSSIPQHIPLDSHPEGLVVSDQNGDAIPDIVVSSPATSETMVLLGLGDGTFLAVPMGLLPDE